MGLFSRTLSRLDELKKALSRDPASRQFLALADELRRQGQVREAIDVLEQGLARNPTAVAGHVALGRLLQQAGRHDDALAAYQAALKLDPQNLVAIRQLADVHLSRGEKVGAIKRLKLFRGLNPGDREVNEIIRQLEGELAGGPAAAPAAGGLARPEEEVPLAAAPPRDAPAASPLPTTAPAPAALAVLPVPGFPEAAPPADSPAEEQIAPSSAPAAVTDSEAAPRGAASATEPGPQTDDASPSPFDEIEARAVGPSAEPLLQTEASLFEEPFGAGPIEEAPAADAPAPEPATVATPFEELPPARLGPVPEPPVVTETLADLLRAQGHLVDAQEAYRELASAEADPARARRFRNLAEDVASQGARTARGRLEAWVEPFARHRGGAEGELSAAVEDVVRRLGGAAVVTDLEGVPVVTAGPRSESEAMENLAAELTAFWKNVRRSRAEIGEGALDSLVLTGSAGTAAVKLITPAYALLLKTGPGVPAGRIRFEATRAAEQLRPALL